jgi:hypothetical protein
MMGGALFGLYQLVKLYNPESRNPLVCLRKSVGVVYEYWQPLLLIGLYSVLSDYVIVVDTGEEGIH